MKRSLNNLWLCVWSCLLAIVVSAQEPGRTAWLVNPQAATMQNEKLARIQPEVHSVTTLDKYCEIRSAGISLYYLGPLQTPPGHIERIRQFIFRVPRFPSAETNAHTSVRPDAVGVFLNGVPIYNQFTGASFQGQNLWHLDPIASSDDGTFVATGRPRAGLDHKSLWGILEQLCTDSSKHSPLLGYAFDGYPIYGPWSFVNADGTGGLRKMRSGYRLRQIKRRTSLPDGTQLTPGQYGPDVSAEFPLGSFVEDYEFVAGSGDLDEFNGRFVKTPEYPKGTYAYILSSDATGRLAFPYLLAEQYFGRISREELSQALIDHLDPAKQPVPSSNCQTLLSLSKTGQTPLQLQVVGTELAVGAPLRLSLQTQNSQQRPIRFLEYVHERPLHLLIVSDDLAEFEHIHPALVAGDRYEITHIFKSGGRYRLYADFTPPGGAQRVESFDITLRGQQRVAVKLAADKNWEAETNGVKVALMAKQPLRAGEDIELSFVIRDKTTDKVPENLTPYLGAWAHFVLIDEALQSFIHAHPIETQAAIGTTNTIHIHNESASSQGPPPTEIRVLTSFPKAGLYKLWAQFQLGDAVIAQPFVMQVKEANTSPFSKVAVPADAIPIKIGASGFTPARLEFPANKPVKLALTRDKEPNCGNQIIFPSLGISRNLPLGETVIVELPALPAGELRFTCGMGMYKGVVVAH